jgi:hypothetical protein
MGPRGGTAAASALASRVGTLAERCLWRGARAADPDPVAAVLALVVAVRVVAIVLDRLVVRVPAAQPHPHGQQRRPPAPGARRTGGPVHRGGIEDHGGGEATSVCRERPKLVGNTRARAADLGALEVGGRIWRGWPSTARVGRAVRPGRGRPRRGRDGPGGSAALERVARSGRRSRVECQVPRTVVATSVRVRRPPARLRSGRSRTKAIFRAPNPRPGRPARPEPAIGGHYAGRTLPFAPTTVAAPRKPRAPLRVAPGATR